jgi:hypothetical protein
LLIIAGSVAFITKRFQANRPGPYPFPYNEIKVAKSEIAKAEKADIVIIGDSATIALENQMQTFNSEVSKDFLEPLNIYNWGARGENLAFTLAKVKSLKKMPLLLIYHGGLDELDHARFLESEINKLKINLDRAKDKELLTAIMSAPILSRFIYEPVKRVELTTSRAFSGQVPSHIAMKIMELSYELYKIEASELFGYLKTIDAKMWVIPQAMDVSALPDRVCENTNSEDVFKTITKVEKALKRKETKLSYNLLKESILANKGNSKLYHLLGQTFMKMGSFTQARKAFYQAMIFDCGLRRTNPIFTKILMEEAEKRDFRIFDFNRIVTNNLGHNILFLNERTPQPLYYQQLNQLLVKDFLKFIK